MARPSGRCSGTVKDFDNLFATNVRSPFLYDKTYGQVFREEKWYAHAKHDGRGQSLDNA